MAARASSSWSAKVENAMRSVEFQINNLTHFQLKLSQVKLEAGDWALPPPNSIPPYGEARFAVVCSTPFTGAEAIVGFAILGLTRQPPGIQFAAGNHLISGRYSRASISDCEKKNFTIRKNENSDSRYVISWSIKTSHPVPLLAKQSSATQAPIQAPIAQAAEPGLPSFPQQLPIDLSSSITPNSTTETPSQSTNTAPARSNHWEIHVNVFNDTHTLWNLEESGLEAGTWKKEPPMELKPFSRAKWFAVPEFAGVVGYAKYRCSNSSSIVFFSKWSVPVLSNPQADALVAGPQPRTLDSELRISHTSNSIIMDVTIFAEGSYHSRPKQSMALTSSVASPGPLSSSLLRLGASSASSTALKVFRMPIEVLVEKEGRSNPVPWLVESVCEWLQHHHARTRNLFSSGGLYGEIKELKELIESGEAMKMSEADHQRAIWTDFSPPSVVSVLKLFLREMPASVIPTSMVPQFMAIETNDSASAYVDQSRVPMITTIASETAPQQSLAVTAKLFKKFIKQLPPTNLHTLLCITRTLHRMWKAPGGIHTLDSMAVIFGPLIAADKPDGSLKSALPVISAYSALIECVDLIRIARPSDADALQLETNP